MLKKINAVACVFSLEKKNSPLLFLLFFLVKHVLVNQNIPTNNTLFFLGIKHQVTSSSSSLFVSFFVFPSFFPSFLPPFLPSFLPSFLPYAVDRTLKSSELTPFFCNFRLPFQTEKKKKKNFRFFSIFFRRKKCEDICLTVLGGGASDCCRTRAELSH